MKDIDKCIHCDDLENQSNGIWKIVIFKKYKYKYGKRSDRNMKWICNICLIEAIEGYRSGGGLQPHEIKKIIHIKN